MDADICGWILEFLLRQQVEDILVKRFMAVFPPIPDENTRLKKTVLLRQIQSEISNGSISEKLLDYLEIIEEMDHTEGVAEVSESMKDAYCAVTVECTVQILEGKVENRGAKYFDAIVRIWRERIGDLERSGNGLVSERLQEWKDDIEASLWDASVCEVLLRRETRSDALRLVRVYVNEELENMGPSFLELAALTMQNATAEEEAQGLDKEQVSESAGAGKENQHTADEGNSGNLTVVEAAQANDENPRNQCCGQQKDLPRPSLMERNSTACTYEWDDSIDALPEGSPSRRKIKKWSLLEEETLRNAVQKFGKGNWKLILNSYGDVFKERTEVDLKDKWRNMIRH